MKLTHGVVAVSLMANVVCLAVFALSPSPSAPGGKTVAVRTDTRTPAVTTATAASASTSIDLAALLRSDDVAKLAEVLRAAGVPEETVRAIVRERISARYLARMRELEMDSGMASRPYWQPARNRTLTAEQRAARRQLQREMTDEMNKIVGTRPNAGNGSDRYAFLAEETRTQLNQVEDDYREMRAELQRGMEEFPLKSEQDALRMLESERKRDIDALLSPEEREAIALRTSPAANSIREQYGAILQSEDEFKQLYQLQRDFLARTSGSANPATRAEASRELQEQINAILGPDRIATLAQQRDPDVRMLQAAAGKLNLSEPAITQATLALRAQASQESQRIASDSSLDAAAKRQALTALGTQVRTQLHGVLGADGGETFAERAGWVTALSRGSAFTVRPEGGVQVTRPARGGANP